MHVVKQGDLVLIEAALMRPYRAWQARARACLEGGFDGMPCGEVLGAARELPGASFVGSSRALAWWLSVVRGSSGLTHGAHAASLDDVAFETANMVGRCLSLQEQVHIADRKLGHELEVNIERGELVGKA